MEKGYPKVVWLFVFVCVQKEGLAEPEPASPAPPRTPARIGRWRPLGAPPASTRSAPEARAQGAPKGRPTADPGPLPLGPWRPGWHLYPSPPLSPSFHFLTLLSPFPMFVPQ